MIVANCMIHFYALSIPRYCAGVLFPVRNVKLYANIEFVILKPSKQNIVFHWLAFTIPAHSAPHRRRYQMKIATTIRCLTKLTEFGMKYLLLCTPYPCCTLSLHRLPQHRSQLLSAVLYAFLNPASTISSVVTALIQFALSPSLQSQSSALLICKSLQSFLSFWMKC